MKTDIQLKKDVMAELASDPAIHETAIGVGVRDGVVTLSGHLDTFIEKSAVERAVRRVDGVRAIALELDIKLSPQHKRSDTEIAAAAEQALRWNSQVPADAVRVTVDSGWVRLQGDVDWDFERQAAYKAVRPLLGIVGISNEITLKKKPTPADVSARIEEALKRQAVREANRIGIDAAGGVITLHGNVHSWQERDAAVGAAWSVPGVQRVISDLCVSA